MSVSLSGLVSGIDVQSLISNLSAAYQQPITLLQKQEQSYQTSLSAWGTLQSSLSSLQSALGALQNLGSSNNRSVSLSNAGVATASVTNGAQLGSYSLSNIVLAQSQSIYSSSFASASNTAVGTGTLQIQVGSGAVSNIVINGGNDTLNGIASAINQANLGVNAAVINDGSGYRLTLTGTGTGVNNAFTVAVSGASGSLAELSYSPGASGGMTLSQAAQNASLSINGLAVTSSSNTVSGAIPGVTLNLQTSGSTTLQVSASNSAFVSAVQSFTSAFNKTMGTINQLTAYNAQTGSGGPLLGSAAVQGLRTQLLNLISGPGLGVSAGSAYNSLGAVGLGLTSSGTITLNTGTLSTALNSDYQTVLGLFSQAGSTSSSNVQFVSASGSVQAGTYAVAVSQLATQATVMASSPVPSGGIAQSESLTIGSGSSSVVVSLASGSSLSQIVNTINATLQQSGMTGLTALSNNGYLELQSSGYGSSQSFTVVSNVAAGASGTGIGTNTLSASGTDVVGTVNGQAASGNGQQLTVTGPGPALGLQLQISGTQTGNLGTVVVSQGLYQQMHSLLSQALDSQTGFVAAAQNGLNGTINGLNAQITTLQQSASNQTALLTQQFAAMQSQLSQLQSIGQYINAFYNTGSSSSSSSGG
ncbi:flagellar filament capping protein FliD [Acidithiobacillus caldus]|uniref:Flagellar hook-associated protein 2 n=4 Tax=Acidithiobacillus TaxID=119977 RepID=F9ZN83_ACICS|nr:flagellar filament capping protein FliD [Acidithiobacillus caldus]AEK58126.1 Flagellar hook-associated protein fliD [Acidithiobacillus caldus SM-1]AIA55114.1 Flagellar hook-associated protein FliD [Acidithiobacillus caldus ATCC 51756]AUW32767.1 flagellar filament capping protein FliD [Acidithiobacillus caldus]MBU2730266.1 flagellar filament capping protein FliD [Acidithiobacillus caldus]MBU2734339.1 flagellar filament capping protein FliD [Acidithiobacillus caldus ATCC 51756]